MFPKDPFRDEIIFESHFEDKRNYMILALQFSVSKGRRFLIIFYFIIPTGSG